MDLDVTSCARLIQYFTSNRWILHGRQLHLLYLKRGLLRSSLVIENCLLQLYTRCGSISDAGCLFEEMTHTNRFSWNTMIEGYLCLGVREKSMELFRRMPHKNDYTWNAVISGFARAGKLEVARVLFNEMPLKNGTAWNSMIHGYAQNGRPEEAIKLFKQLSSNPSYTDSFVLTTVLRACSKLTAIDCGKQIHAHVIVGEMESDSVLKSSIVNLYGKCGDLDSASIVLSSMPEPDDFSLSSLFSAYASSGRMRDARRFFDMRSNRCVTLWNSLIAGYVANDDPMEALVLFNKMRGAGVGEGFPTLVSVLNACSILGFLGSGKQMHCHACKTGFVNDLIFASALVDLYYKCGSHGDACELFDELPVHDTILLNSMITVYSNCGRIESAKLIFNTMRSKTLISWNSMLVGFSQNGYPVEALDLFCEMNTLGLRLDTFSLSTVISACGSIPCLELGEQLFARAIVVGLECNEITSTSLVDLYCKCGVVESGRKLFDSMMKFDEAAWNSMLLGYAANGRGINALQLFDDMIRANVKPTVVTFMGVLSACDHCGLVEEGEKWFHVMKWEYGLNPEMEHYACMVDLFARTGCLEKAMDLIEHMPFQADAKILSSVLRGCTVHGHTALAKKIACKMLELDPENSVAYVQLSTLCATSGDWDGLAQVRKEMKEKQLQKTPGFSWEL